MAAKAECPVCHITVAVNNSGLLRVHGPRCNQCPGSNIPSTSQSAVSPANNTQVQVTQPSLHPTNEIDNNSPPSGVATSTDRGSPLSPDHVNSPSLFTAFSSSPISDPERDTDRDGHYLEQQEIDSMFLTAYGSTLCPTGTLKTQTNETS